MQAGIKPDSFSRVEFKQELLMMAPEVDSPTRMTDDG